MYNACKHYSHFTSMDACAAVSASAPYDISKDIPSDNGEDNIGKIET